MMAGKKKGPLRPSPEARDGLVTVIRSTAAPLAARVLAKLLPAPHKIAMADLVPILDEYIAAGTLCSHPPKSAKSKPRYWDRDARAMSRAAALEAMQKADSPLTTKELLRRLVVPLKLTELELTQILDDAVAERTLHVIPPTTSKSKPRYWHRDAPTFGRLEILKALAEE